METCWTNSDSSASACHNTSSEVELMETHDLRWPGPRLMRHNTSSEVELMETNADNEWLNIDCSHNTSSEVELMETVE